MVYDEAAKNNLWISLLKARFKSREKGLQTRRFAVDNLFGEKFGAGNETRTRDPDLGKVVLYQLSYSRLIFVFQVAA